MHNITLYGRSGCYWFIAFGGDDTYKWQITQKEGRVFWSKNVAISVLHHQYLHPPTEFPGVSETHRLHLFQYMHALGGGMCSMHVPVWQYVLIINYRDFMGCHCYSFKNLHSYHPSNFYDVINTSYVLVSHEFLLRFWVIWIHVDMWIECLSLSPYRSEIAPK